MDPDQYYSEDISRIKEIEFSVLSNEETKRMSSVRKDPFGINAFARELAMGLEENEEGN